MILRKTTMVKSRFLGVIVMVLWVMLGGPSGGRTPQADRGRRVVRRAEQLAPLTVKLFVCCEDVGCSFESRM